MKLKFDFLTKCLLLFVVAMGMSSLAMAQRTLSGVVTDSDSGDPLIGANILVAGTSAGTITDIDGSYSIKVPDGATELVISYTGYAEKRMAIGASNVMDITLSSGELLDEVVVVGYSSVKKSDLTGSVVSVGEEDFNKGLVVSPDQLIQGKAAGVQILNNSGQPGGLTTVRIRGNSSIRGGNQPLFVVDGVQLTGNSTKPGANTGDIGSTPGSNPLNYLNPSDIESIQVLKDASATAIYGSRGANGVIIITTKKGRAGVPSISFNSSVGFSSILNKYEVLDASEYRAALNQYGATSGDYGDDVDMFDEILRTGLTNNHGISIGGGSETGTYRVSLSYLNQEGIVKKNALERVTANISGNYKFFDSRRVGVDFNLITSHTKDNGPAIATNSGFRGSLIGNALQWNPTHRIYESDGSPVILPEFGNFTNPVALLDAYNDEAKTVDIIASITPYVKLTDFLTYKFNYSVTHGVGTRRVQVASWINLQGIEGRGLAGIFNENNTNQILTHTLNLNQEIGNGINLNAVLGYEYQNRKEGGYGMSGQDFIVETFDYTNILQNTDQGSRNISSGQAPDAELQSYFVQGIFNIQDRFLVTATFRADGSSKFGENNRYGYFPAVAGAWNLHNEDFLADSPFDALKLRASWGQTGNSEFPAGASQDRFSFGQQSVGLENVANPDLTWETTTTYEFGVDFSAMDYKLNGTIGYFNRKSEDLLFQFPTIQPAPAGFYWINLDGAVQNSGLEVTIDANILQTESMSWNVGFNAAFINNELQDYNGPNIVYGQLFGQGISGATIHRLDSGQPLNAFYLRDHIEIGEDGQSVYANDEALSYVGDPNPSTLLGISTDFTTGDLSISLNFNGAMGMDVYNNTKNTVIPIGNLGSRNVDASLIGGTQEAVSNAIKSSDRYLEDGSYLKLANATVSYNLGNLNESIKNARIFVSGTNLLVFTGYSGFDPEVNTVNDLNGLPSAGIEYIPYPSARTIMLGAGFSF